MLIATCRVGVLLLGSLLFTTPALSDQPSTSVSIQGSNNVSIVDNKGVVTVTVANKNASFKFINRFHLELDAIREILQNILRVTNHEGKVLEAHLMNILQEQGVLKQECTRLSEMLSKLERQVGSADQREIKALQDLDKRAQALGIEHNAQFESLRLNIRRLQYDTRSTLVAKVSRSRIERYGYALLFGGGAALGIAGGLAGIAVYLTGEAKDDCDGDFCGPRGLGSRHRAVRLGNTATGFFVVGCTMLAASGVTFLLARSAEIHDRNSTIEVSALASATGASVNLTQRW